MGRVYLDILKDIINNTLSADGDLILLFGTRAAGKAHDRSDIDIGIWGDRPLSSLERYELERKIENSRIPFLVDMVDFSETQGAFKKEALRDIEIWNDNEELAKKYLKTAEE